MGTPADSYDKALGMGFSTAQLHVGHKTEPVKAVGWGWGGIGGGGARAPPIYLTTSYQFDDAAHGADLFGLRKLGNIYTRIMNPTTSVFEDRVAKLEGGTMAVATSSGMAAQLLCLSQFMQSGDNFVSASHLYGGTYNQFKTLFKQYGIEARFSDGNGNIDSVKSKIDENTKCIYVETIGNPSFYIPDFAALKTLADQYEIPIVVDNTFGMAGYTCRPLQLGAHVIVASATKWIGGHGTTIGGVIVDSSSFAWDKPVRSVLGDPSSPPVMQDGKPKAKFPLINGPCEAYHDMNLWDVFGPSGPFGANIALAVRARVIGLRDMGACQNPMGSFLLVQGLETLSLRARAHSNNANQLAVWLSKHEAVTWVSHPSLPAHPSHENAKKYFRPGCFGAVLSFGIKGGSSAASAFISALKLVSHVANVGDAKTLAIHPSSTTHEQLSEKERLAAGVTEDMIRISVGFEDIEDIQADFEGGFEAAKTEEEKGRRIFVPPSRPDAERKAFAKDFVPTPAAETRETPPAVPQPPTQPLAAPQPLTATATPPGAPKPAAPAKPATAATASPHPAVVPAPSASACCVLN